MDQLLLFIGVIVIAYIFGSLKERRHYKRLKEREKRLLHIPVITDADYELTSSSPRVKFVTGSIVYAGDFFKVIWGELRSLFGGTVTAYESILDRARREAIVRMKLQAQGARIILNVRITTVNISSRTTEVIAYGTALYDEGPQDDGTHL